MFFYKDLSCPHCHHRFHETDDIVACPECGAPHHRGCWGDAGGCACREDHGTERQWSREKALSEAEQASAPSPASDSASSGRPLCPHCGTPNSPYAETCYHCGQALKAQEWTSSHTPPPPPATAPFSEYTPFHVPNSPYGGVDPTAEIDGETAEDLASVVRTNTAYYLPRFRMISQSDSRLSWNWAGFLLAPYWLMFRKQYLAGAIALLLDILSSTASNIVLYTRLSAVFVENSMGQTVLSYAKWMELMYTDERVFLPTALIAMLGMTMMLFHVVIGLFGTRLYMNDCRRKIGKARAAYPEGYRAQLSVTGGTSFALGLLGVLLSQTLPSLLLGIFLG